MNARAESIEHRLDAVRERIERACRRAGRRSGDVTLIGITKTFPLDAVVAAREAGLLHFGENRVQELVEKASHVPGRIEGGSVEWYMVGHLQRNKTKDVVDHADYFHALDSRRLAAELNKRAGRKNRVVPCLVQVNISGEASKYGVDPGDVRAFLVDISRCENLRVEGLMTIASYVDDPEDVRSEFQEMQALFDRCKTVQAPNIRLTCLSMGMSNDFEVAIEEGATHVRIGSAIFGERSTHMPDR